MSISVIQPLDIPSCLVHDKACTAIVRAVAYFDLFHYPLTSAEIHQFLDQHISEEQLKDGLNRLVVERILFTGRQYYSLQSNPLFIYRRIQGNIRAEKLIPTALRIGRFLNQLPFVRGVAISGSLSKNYADAKSDIDFFIITRADRLWIARTIMHMVKKLSFLVGKQHWFCMNYYVDEKALLITEQNIFTATEIKTLLLVAGHNSFADFFKANSWAHEILPGCDFPKLQSKPAYRWSLKAGCEWLINQLPVSRVESYLFKQTTRRWNKKTATGRRNEKGLSMGLLTGPHFAKSNPGHFQETLLQRYNEKLQGQKYGA